ncbi:remorin isoform X1 [Zea mays]|uniref:Remorin n=1 Tax=Zea mays TaxID=4577 RepID=A0A1D6JAY4_MAIZE|nr:remorin isoform X1 [Zea mays]AQK45055.1 Remorin [Zea mays]|eukprot:XP_008661880.1 remorin isoform X1 [Zea mays]
MTEEEAKKVEVEVEVTKAAPAKENAAEEKAVIPATEPPAAQEKPPAPADDSKALAIVENKSTPEKPIAEKQGGSSIRDLALARVETEKRNSLIKAWEDNEKAKADNKATKKVSVILSWENTKKANIEAEMKKIEEQLEKKKAEYAEKMKNKVAMIHREAEEKRAMVEAKRGEEVLKAEEMAAKYRATGHAPKKPIGCFGA